MVIFITLIQMQQNYHKKIHITRKFIENLFVKSKNTNESKPRKKDYCANDNLLGLGHLCLDKQKV